MAGIIKIGMLAELWVREEPIQCLNHNDATGLAAAATISRLTAAAVISRLLASSAALSRLFAVAAAIFRILAVAAVISRPPRCRCYIQAPRCCCRCYIQAPRCYCCYIQAPHCCRCYIQGTCCCCCCCSLQARGCFNLRLWLSR
jgi:hypothetical protein